MDPLQMRWRKSNPNEERKKLSKFLARLSWVSMGEGQTKIQTNPSKNKRKKKKNNESEEDAIKPKPL